MSVEDALKKFSAKDAKKWAPKKKRKKLGKPEKEVEKQVMAWAQSRKFFLHVVEARSVYSAAAGRYLHGQAVPGFPDVVGSDPHGHAVFIELKAPGRRASLRPAQREFLKKAIYNNCFAICADSVDFVRSAYENWLKVSPENRVHLLNGLLPRSRARNGEDRETLDL